MVCCYLTLQTPYQWPSALSAQVTNLSSRRSPPLRPPPVATELPLILRLELKAGTAGVQHNQLSEQKKRNSKCVSPFTAPKRKRNYNSCNNTPPPAALLETTLAPSACLMLEK